MNLSYLDFQLHRRVAVLDLGTNTFNIVIAEGNQKEFQILYEEKVAVKIGRGGIQQKIIIQEAQQRALKAMQYYQDILQNYQVDLENVYAFATSAFRNAQNGEDLAALITEITGIEVPIISGAQEATYIYQGVNHALDLSERTNLIMDIGGGSVEFIIANKNRIFWKRSYEIGAQRLWTKFMKNDPIDTVNLSMLEIFLESELFSLSQVLFQFAPQLFVGASGAFETLRDIYEAQQAIEELTSQEELLVQKVPRNHIPTEEFYQIYYEITRSNQAQRLEMPGMSPIRADMMVVAMVLLKFIIEKGEFDTIQVSPYSLREGVLMNLL